MSPVSRSRKSKKSKKSKKAKKRPGRAPGASLMIEAEPGLDWLRSGGPQSPFNRLFLPPDEPDWWQPAHERVIGASVSLLAAQGPRALLRH